jgi:hypothetical protein
MKKFLIMASSFISGCLSPSENDSRPVNLNSIHAHKSWIYSVEESSDGIPVTNRIKFISIDSVFSENDSVFFKTTEIDTGFQLPGGSRKDTVRSSYLQFAGKTSLVSGDGTLVDPGLYFGGSAYEAGNLKRYRLGGNQFLYHLEERNEEGKPFVDTAYDYRLLYIERIGLVEMKDTWTFVGGHVHSGGKHIRLLSMDGESINASIFDRLN